MTLPGISLYDGEGGKLTTLGKDFEVFNRAPVENNFAYSNVFRPNSSSEAYFTISYPVYDLPRENYDRQIGMIVLVMRGSWFSSYLKDTAITENEHVYLVDKRNMVIAGDQDKEFYELDVEGLQKDKNSLVQTVDQEETSWPDRQCDSGTGDLQWSEHCSYFNFFGNDYCFSGAGAFSFIFLLFHHYSSYSPGRCFCAA